MSKTLKRLELDDLFELPPPKTRVVNMTEEHYDVRIDRKTKWGNPFQIGVDGTRDEVIKKYSDWIVNQEHLMNSLPELTGKKLGCWCRPKSCHGDVLARLADSCEASKANERKI